VCSSDLASMFNVENFPRYLLCASNDSKHNDANLKHDHIMSEEAG
jgi:hypothetical protein